MSHRSYQRTKTTLNKIISARQRGDYAYEQPFYAAEGTQYQRAEDLSHVTSSLSKTSTPCEQHLLLSELIEKFCTSQIADGAWKPHTLIDHRNRLENIVDILGDIEAAKVTRQQMRLVRDTLKKLPPSRKKKPAYRDKSVEEILQMEYDKKLSIKTVNDSIEAISSMFGWAIREQLLTGNPSTGLKLRDEEPDIEKKDAFDLADIKQIFFSGDYNPSAFSKPAYFWCPLIALYSGMRLEEICQLQCKDVYDDEGVWVFDINPATDTEEASKKLKTKNAIRKVPVHPYLISKGLLKHLEKVRSVKIFLLSSNARGLKARKVSILFAIRLHSFSKSLDCTMRSSGRSLGISKPSLPVSPMAHGFRPKSALSVSFPSCPTQRKT